MRVKDFRRFVTLALMVAIPCALAGCREQPEGSVKVTVIGGPPKLRDPAAGPLPAGDALLLSNVAQGLVRFDAAGNIVGGLAERWNVSNDGLSYIFRLAPGDWPNGGKITAKQVARLLKRQLTGRSRNPMRDALGAVEDVVAMTDRVIEIRLVAPRPNLLPLLAQPEMAVLREGHGTGPFTESPTAQRGLLLLKREIVSPEDESKTEEDVLVGGATAGAAVQAFAAGQTDLVLGGTFADLPIARRVKLPRGSLRFDPASGLFGLVPTRKDGPLAEPDVRRLLSQAIDRDLLVRTLNVPGLTPRATIMEPGLEGVPAIAQPAWATTPLSERSASLAAEARRLFGAEEKPVLRIGLPQGPGADVLLLRLMLDWGALGFTIQRANSPGQADLVLVDDVAPSSSPAWYVRRFRCEIAPICDPEADELMASARAAPVPAQRAALLVQAAARLDDALAFIPLAAPVRWSLVGSRIEGFAGNRYARHTLTGLEQKTSPGG